MIRWIYVNVTIIAFNSAMLMHADAPHWMNGLALGCAIAATVMIVEDAA